MIEVDLRAVWRVRNGRDERELDQNLIALLDAAGDPRFHDAVDELPGYHAFRDAGPCRVSTAFAIPGGARTL